MKYRVLVVDDEPHIVDIIRFTLEHVGFEVLTALDGKDGLRAAREEAPDLIILDLMLPNIDGFKICRLLKFDGRFRHIPIILLSARSERADRELGAEVGANLFMAKPFEPDELAHNVCEFLSIETEV